MKATELRIGNWVYQSSLYGNAQCSAYEIYNFDRMQKCGFGADYYKHWEPIPITPEIFEKAGFLNNNGYFSHQKLGPTFLQQGADWFFVKTMGGGKLTTIKYVHQLQNLYFALTGEELKIKLIETERNNIND